MGDAPDDFALKVGDEMLCLLQNVANAIGELPGVWDRIEAYLMGCGHDDPRQEWADFRRFLDG